MIGKTIGKYRFVEELGRGPLGTVYKAIDETLDREVAIKVLNPELSNSELMKHFQTEATTLARLHHSDIATIHEIHHTDTDLLMVMEFVKGETLDHLAERCGPLPPERAAYLVAQVLGALEHAHNAGVVHRDLTPSSVMVTEYGAIKVMDFGMARVAAADQATSDGFALGPPSYMSPERLAGGEVDGRTDVYSAGVIFYRLLTGHVPFEAATPLEMVQKQLSGAPTPLHTYREELPGWCQAIVDRAIARIADDRFPTAEAFRSTLNAAISEATESTGLYAVVQAGTAEPEDLTIAAPIPATDAAPIPFADAPTVATWTPAASTPPASATAETQRITPPSAPTVTSAAAAATGTTVVIKRNQFAVVGGLLLALVLGVVVLAIVALRRPATVIMAPAETAATNSRRRRDAVAGRFHDRSGDGDWCRVGRSDHDAHAAAARDCSTAARSSGSSRPTKSAGQTHAPARGDRRTRRSGCAGSRGGPDDAISIRCAGCRCRWRQAARTGCDGPGR